MRTVLPRSHHELHLVISLPVPYHASPADVPVRVRRVTEKRCFDEGESGNQQWTDLFKKPTCHSANLFLFLAS